MKRKILNRKLLLVCLVALIAVLSFTLAPTETAFADDIDYYNISADDYYNIFTYSTSSSQVTITGLNTAKVMVDKFIDADGHYNIDIIIPATIDGNPVVAISSKAFYTGSSSSSPTYDSNIRIQYIDLSGASNLETIGSSAFYNYLSTTCDLYSELSGELVLPNSLKTISDNAFTGLNFTGDLTIPDSVETIGSCAFQDCGFDGKLTLPNNENFTTISFNLFYRTPFTELDWNISENNYITTIGNKAFQSTNLSYIEIPEGVTTLGGTIFGDTEYEYIVLPSTITTVTSTYVFDYIASGVFVYVNFNEEDVLYSGSNDFTWYLRNSNFTIVVDESQYADFVASSTSSRTNYTYETTLTFDDNDSETENETRTVLFNQAINLQPVDGSIAWEVDETYTLPEVGDKEQWSFVNETTDGTNIITESSLVAGKTLYKVTIETVQDYYTYYEFGTYKQTQFTDSTNDKDSDMYKEAIAAIEEAEADGREFYVYETTTWIYWFEYEPILWRYLDSSDEGLYMLSEYILDVGAMGTSDNGNYYLTALEDSTLYGQLQDVFIPEAFTTAELSDYNISITLPLYSFLNDSDIFPSADYLKATRTDYTNYIGSNDAYWTSYVWGEINSSYTMYTRYVNASGEFKDYYNNSTYGARPMMFFTPDTTKYTTTGSGTFEDPYKFVLIADVTPEIESQSDNQTVFEGQAGISISVVVVESDYISDVTYQWYTADGSIIDGATDAEYSISEATATESYYCIVTNEDNSYSATSENITITVISTDSADSAAIAAAVNSMINVEIAGVEELKTEDEIINAVLDEIIDKMDAFVDTATTADDVENIQEILHVLQEEAVIVSGASGLSDLVGETVGGESNETIYSVSKDFTVQDEPDATTVVTVYSENAITYAVIDEEISATAKAEFDGDYSGYTIEQEFTIIVGTGEEIDGNVIVDTGVLWESGKTYIVLHWTADGVEVIDCVTIDNGDGTYNVGFETDEFSPFQVLSTATTSLSSSSNVTISSVYTVGGSTSASVDEDDVDMDEDMAVEPEGDTEAEQEDSTSVVVPTTSPSTTDYSSSSNAWIWIFLGVLVVGGIVGFVVFKKKQQ